ncbi:ectonucleotide pyrophosphatase/phosphodiesterase [Chitinophagaceae bacterium LWZ2-11]
MFLKRIIPALLLISTAGYLHAQDTTQKVVADRFNSKQQETKPYVILISADGFRADLAEKYNATNLLQLRETGVAAAYMQSSFPSLTFPNHYTIVTGLYPSHHGLVDNSFFDENRKEGYGMSNKKAVADSSWYGGTPLWVLAEQQKMLSASFYWVASESAIKGVRPTYYYIYNEKISIDKRVQTVKDWLQLPEDKRPHLITFYFPEVDHAEHMYGPESPQAAEAVHFVDESIGKLVKAAGETNLPINFIFVSDHGMTKVDTAKAIPMPQAIDTSKFYVPNGDALVHLYAKDKGAIQSTYLALKAEAKDYDVYLAEEMPERWHYSKKDDKFNRIGDIILVPHLPGYFSFGKRKGSTIGKHGFDPAIVDMRATFYAWGPAFKTHLKIDGFENIHIYPLVAEILGLTYSDIDGKAEVLKPILK